MRLALGEEACHATLAAKATCLRPLGHKGMHSYVARDTEIGVVVEAYWDDRYCELRDKIGWQTLFDLPTELA